MKGSDLPDESDFEKSSFFDFAVKECSRFHVKDRVSFQGVKDRHVQN